MCREAPSLSLCPEPWRLRLLTPSSPSPLLSSCTGRAVCPRGSAAWMERVRSPRLVRSLPQGLGLPGSGVTMVVSLRVPALFSECPLQPSEPLGHALSLTVSLIGSLCASQPLVGADLPSTAPSPAHTIPARPAPLCRECWAPLTGSARSVAHVESHSRLECTWQPILGTRSVP